MAPLLHQTLGIGAQTAYAELLDQLSSEAFTNLRALPGSFQRQQRRGRTYVYYSFRDADGQNRLAYLGPDDERVQRVIASLEAAKESPAPDRVRRQAAAALALGCGGLASKHFRIVERLGQYGFFRAGGLLIGTHAFLAIGNMLGVRWREGDRTLDLDFAHAGRNVSIALGANLQLAVPDALSSLEMGLLPVMEFSGRTSAQWRNPDDPELRIDFLTARSRRPGPVRIEGLGLQCEPLPFLEMLLEEPERAALPGPTGATLVNVPSPTRYAIHKLIVQGERVESQRAKARKDLAQTAALASYYLAEGNPERFAATWQATRDRGSGWARRLDAGRRALLRAYPGLDAAALWD